MPIRLSNSSAVMTRRELYEHQRAGVPVFPEAEQEEESSSLVLYESREPLTSSRRVKFVEFEERRPKRYIASSNKHVEFQPVAPAPKRYEIPPPPIEYYMAQPAPLILPAPIPQPIVAQPTPPPAAPEAPTTEQRSRTRRQDDRRAQPSSSLRVEPPRSHRHDDGSSSPRSASSTGSSRSYRSARDGQRRSSFVSTPGTSPARSQTKKGPKMIEESSKGPKAWREEMRLRDPIVFRNKDGSTTKQYYYQ